MRLSAPRTGTHRMLVCVPSGRVFFLRLEWVIPLETGGYQSGNGGREGGLPRQVEPIWKKMV